MYTILDTEFNNPHLRRVQMPGFYDDFSVNPNSDGLGNTSRDGKSWVHLGGTRYYRHAGGFAAAPDSADTIIDVVEGDSNEGTLTAQLRVAATSSDKRYGLVWNLVDGANFLYVMHNTADKLSIYSRVDNANTNLQSTDYTLQDGDILSVSFTNTYAEVFVNGELKIESEVPTQLNGTRHGLFRWGRSDMLPQWNYIRFTPA